ncbi:MAG: CpaF family protein [Candidatus Dormibacteria bacterium]
MSLLDRVQRKAEEVTPGTFAAGQPREVAPQVTPMSPTSPPLRPAPSAPADGGGAGGRPAGGPGTSALLNRTNLQRPGMARPGTQTNAAYLALKHRVHARLVEELASSDAQPDETVRARIAELVNDVVSEQGLTMTRHDRQRVAETVVHDVLGLGPLEALLKDEAISEIMINGPKQVYVEQKGRLTLSSVQFDSNDQLMQVIDRIVSSIGRRVDESSPMVDARLKDGSRVNVIIPPLALRGPTVTIRKFSRDALQTEDLVKYGSATEDMLRFLMAAVRGRLNVVVSGGTGSGKTTTLNILSSFIPADERIVTIEDAAELQLRQEHVVTLETRPSNVEGKGAIHIRELVINSLRMRPDRIVIGECRGGEALDMLQAMNTGHDGSLTTLHANSPTESIGRLETLVLMAGADLPSRAIREQIASAVHLIVQQSRLRDGSRKIVSITEVIGIANGEVQLQEIFTFNQTGVDDEGRVLGALTPTGIIPHFREQLAAEGEPLPLEMFQAIKLAELPSRAVEHAATG